MMQYDLFRKMAQSNLTTKDREVNQIKYDIAQEFDDSPSFNSVLIDGVSMGVQIVTDKTDNKKMLSKPDEVFTVGQIVTWKTNKFLVTDIDEDQQIQTKGIILLCNNVLNVNKNSILSQIPCIFSDGIISLEEGKFISLPSGHYEVIIPSGIITKSDLNLRYILNDAPYKTVGISNAINGLIKIELIDDAFNEKDDIINGIAWNEGNPTYNYTMEILNGAEQTIKYGESLTLNIQVKNNGVLVSPIPSLIYETSNGTVCTVDTNGIITATSDAGSAIITVKLADSLSVLANITIHASSSVQTNYTYTLVGSVQPDNQISYNQTKSYIATKYDSNNNIINVQFLFQVIGDIPTDKYILTIVDGNQCSLKCKDYTYLVTLRAIDISNSQYFDKPITLKSLL